MSRYVTRVALLLLAVSGGAWSGCGEGGAEDPETARGGITPIAFLAPNSVWRKPLSADAPVDPRSDAYVAELRRQLEIADPWINTTEFSTPIVTVPGSQPDVRVHLDTEYSALQADFERVPLPTTAQPAEGTDGHLVVHQPSTDTMWEFFKAELRPDGWHARWGAKLEQVSRHPGYIAAPEGATATGLPLVGGLMTIDELRSGRIDHALALAIPEAATDRLVFPAQRTDGKLSAPDAIPEGTRFRLDPDLDIERLGLPPPVDAMARAAQRYGIIVRDQSGAVVFYGEDPPPSDADAYGEIFDGQYPSTLLERFPWNQLEAVTPKRD